MIRAVVVAVAIAGCGQHLNPEYCAAHPGDCPADAAPMPDAAACEMDTECNAGVCDLTRHECVECLPDDNPCQNPTPVCSSDHHCVPPTCDSGVALPDGSCADAARILYVGPDGTIAGNDCSMNLHCTLTEALGRLAAGGAEDVVHLDDGTYTGPVKLMVPHHTIVLGIHPRFVGGDPVVGVPAGSDVELDFVTISGATGTGVGLACEAGATLHALGISVTNNLMGGYGMTSACTLDVDTAVIAGNTHGGLQITGGAFDVRNTRVLANGDGGLRTGPVDLHGTATDSFRFNTVVDNTVKSGGGGAPTSGVQCTGGVAVDGNLITNNHNQASQATGCDFTKSYTMNGNGAEIMWVSQVTGDYHLTSQSPVIDVSGVDCTGYKDMDGQMRPIGGGCDLGADEYKP